MTAERPRTAPGPRPIHVVWFAIGIVVLLTALLSYEVWQHRERSAQRGKHDVSLNTQLLTAYVRANLSSIDQLALRLTTDLMSGHQPNQNELRQLKSLDSKIMDIMLLSATGEVQSWTGVGDPPVVSDRPYFTLVKERPMRPVHISPAMLSRVHEGHWFFAISRGLANGEGMLVGVAVVLVDLDFFERDLMRWVGDSGASASVFLQDGTVLIHLPKDSLLPYGTFVPEVARFVDSTNQFALLETTWEGNTQPQLTALNYLSELPVITATSLSQEQIFGDFSRSIRLRAVVWLVALIIIGIFGRWLYRSVKSEVRHVALLARLSQRLSRLAATDGLTQLPNRRHFEAQARVETERAIRHNLPLSLIIIDADHFKKINDQHGHAVGDEALRHLATECAAVLRESDVLGRIGGEEFAVLMPHTELHGALDLANRICSHVGEKTFSTADGVPLTLQVSIGVSVLRAGETHWEPALQRADRALYRAKNKGRNRVESEL